MADESWREDYKTSASAVRQAPEFSTRRDAAATRSCASTESSHKRDGTPDPIDSEHT